MVMSASCCLAGVLLVKFRPVAISAHRDLRGIGGAPLFKGAA